MTILCLIGVCWFGVAALFVTALAVAARRGLPVQHADQSQSLMFDKAA
jgi:hypothetical protein